MKCYSCGSEFRITFVQGKPYCFRCEVDASLVAHGIIQLTKGERNHVGQIPRKARWSRYSAWLQSLRMARCSWAIFRNLARIRGCGVHRERKVVLMLIPSWAKFKEPLRVSEASLRRIQRQEQEKALQRLADERNAQKLHNQPQQCKLDL